MDVLGFEGVVVFTPQLYSDRRGTFHEWFSGDDLQRLAKRRLVVQQANCSTSRQGVIRGIHFTDVPPGQAKYITCISGKVLDVVVDVRVASPSFAQWVAVELSAENRKSIFIPEGLGHGFAALTDNATVCYLCSTSYNPGHERTVHPLDPDIGIDWPADITPVLSDKDASAPSLKAALSSGLLPGYAQCKALLNERQAQTADEAARTRF